MASPSKPTDSLDHLFDNEKEASVESQPLETTRKRSRKEGETTGSSAASQRRRVTRSVRVGSGFRNKPEDLVDVDEEEEDKEGESNEEEDATIEVPESGASSLSDIPESVCTAKTLARLQREYQIPDSITLTLPYQSYEVGYPTSGQVPVHVAAFECRLRLPLHPTLRRILSAIGLSPIQISPEFWKHLVGFLVLWREQCEIDEVDPEPGYDEFRYVFQIAALQSASKGQFYVRAKNKLKFGVPGASAMLNRPWGC